MVFPPSTGAVEKSPSPVVELSGVEVSVCVWFLGRVLHEWLPAVSDGQFPSSHRKCPALHCRQRPRRHHEISQVGFNWNYPHVCTWCVTISSPASLEYPNTSSTTMQADQHSKVVMVFTLTNKEKSNPITVHQVRKAG